jgi:exocyst complex component 2
MDFYGLDTLTPETWNDDSEYQNGGTRDANVPENEENEDGQSVNTFNAPSAQVVIDDLEDLSDPLGVKSLSYATKSRSMVKKKGAVMLTSKEFDAKKFLADVHRGTTFKNLEEGYERLNVTVEQRTEKLKSLVKGNFDRFVGAKATVDAIYKELKSKNLNSEDYGTDKFKKKLKDVSDACGSLYGPIIERRLKAEKIRSVLGVLERYRFFFNLPASLEELIKANKYEQAVRDVKKGKSMLNTAFPGIFSKEPKEKSSGSIKNGGLEAVFDKVWNEVERITDILREFLFNELSDMKIDMEQQERNINLLHELNHEVGMKDPSSKLSEDPLSFYLKCFNDWILRQFDVKKGEYSTKAPKVLNSELLISTPKIENVKFKRGVFVSVRGDYEKVFGRDLEVEYWKSLTVFVKDLSSFLVTSLPDFYRLTKPMLLSQSKQLTSPVSPSKKKAFNSTTLYSKADAEKCRRMVSEILNRYSMIVEEVLAPILAKDSKQVTSIVSCVHFTPQIVKDLSSTYDSISDVLKQSLKIDEAIVKNDLLALSNVSNRIKSFALDKLLHLWKVEASLFYQRDYFDSPDSGYLSLLHKFQKLVLSSLADILRSSTHNNLQFLQNVVSGFVESVYLLLDGLHYLVFDVEDKSNEIHEKKTLVILSCVYSLRFEYLDKWVGLIKQLSVAGPDFLKAEDLDNMKDTIDHLTQLLFSFYIKSKRHVLSSIVKKGCMLSGYDWNTSAKPEGVSPFVNEALMYLVFIHSQIYSLITVPELLKR